MMLGRFLLRTMEATGEPCLISAKGRGENEAGPGIRCWFTNTMPAPWKETPGFGVNNRSEADKNVSRHQSGDHTNVQAKDKGDLGWGVGRVKTEKQADKYTWGLGTSPPDFAPEPKGWIDGRRCHPLKPSSPPHSPAHPDTASRSPRLQKRVHSPQPDSLS